MPPSATPKPPPYSQVWSAVLDDLTRITIHCNCKIFTIILNLKDEAIRGTRLEAEYRRRVSKFTLDFEPIRRPSEINWRKDGENRHKFCEWIFAFPDFLAIKLGPRDGNDKQLSASLVTDAPEVPKEDRTIPFRTIPVSALGDYLVGRVKFVSAADISIPSTYIPPEEIIDSGYVVNYHNTCDTPRLVRTLDGEDKFFKPIKSDRSGASFTREVTALRRVAESGLHAELRVPKLDSVVISSDGESVLGILQDWLPFGLRSLENGKIRSMKKMHAKWEEQVVDMINVLHSNDMVWNHVLPEHILIDQELNAWLIGFNGPSWTEYSSKPLVLRVNEWRELHERGRSEWDLYGVKKIFGEWIRERPTRPARRSKKRARESPDDTDNGDELIITRRR